MKKTLIASALIAACSSSIYAAEEVKISKSLNKNLISSKQGVSSSELTAVLGLSNNHQLSQQTQNTDLAGNYHTRYQQTYRGIKVWGQHVIQHARSNKGTANLTGSLIRGIEKDLGHTFAAKFDQAEAINKSKAMTEAKFGKISQVNREEAEQVIFLDPVTKKAVLAYYSEIYAITESGNPIRPMFIIDASTGRLLSSWNSLSHVDVTGPGGNEKTGQYHFGTEYDALDASVNGDDECVLENDNVKAIDLANTQDTSKTDAFTFACSENTYKEINGAYSPINDAYFFGNLAFDMFNDWYDTAPLPFKLSMKVHFGENFENAFWDGQAMTFGDGATTFYPLVDVNVSVHEVSHGFTDFNSDLIYANQSGGMNEAFSDIAGEAAEYYWRGSVDWNIGADIMKDGDGLRFFEHPTEDGRSIEHAKDYVNGIDVHLSSGIFNRAYYLMSTTEGWDPRKAFDLFVLANQSYWTPNSTFEEGACGVIAAAIDLDYDWKVPFYSMIDVGVVCKDINIDTDEDGINDGMEIFYGLDPESAEDAEQDLDFDGLTNLYEISHSMSPLDTDSDDDGLSDADEVNVYLTNPASADSDGDGIFDKLEIDNELNPNDPADGSLDLDMDTFSNADEAQSQSDLNDATSFKSPLFSHANSFETGNRGLYIQDFSGSDGSFNIDETHTSDGVFSLKADAIEDGEAAIMVWSAKTSAGTFSFDVKVSSEQYYDWFYIVVDGSLAYYDSGESDWRTVPINFSAGYHEIAFVYLKDGLESAGDDTVWLDNFVFQPTLVDADGDLMDDRWEATFGLDSTDSADADLDSDSDGLDNKTEFSLNTDPSKADTDSDGLNDYDELMTHETSADNSDTDGDGISDGWELQHMLNPLDATDGDLDADNDGYSNLVEFQYNGNPNIPSGAGLPETIDFLFENFSGTDFSSSYWALNNQAVAGGVLYKESWSLANGALNTHILDNGKNAEVTFSGLFRGGEVFFNLATSTERSKDPVTVYLDDVKVKSLSGDTSGDVSFAVSQGVHTIRIAFEKDVIGRDNNDSAMITNFYVFNPSSDQDNDGLTNEEELYIYGTNPEVADSDGDGASDYQEVKELGSDPWNADSDGDGVIDSEDLLPNDSSRWTSKKGGSLFYVFALIALFGVRKRYR